jgi:toxin CcdB
MIDVQSDLLSELPTRLVVPLALRKHMPAALPRALCPQVQWDGETLVALPHLAAPFRVKDLGTSKGSLRSQASELVGALDAVISGV